jgi:hypothetical protein
MRGQLMAEVLRQMEEVLTQTHILATVRDEVGGDKHVKFVLIVLE